jgi:hypothetical protein
LNRQVAKNAKINAEDVGWVVIDEGRAEWLLLWDIFVVVESCG